MTHDLKPGETLPKPSDLSPDPPVRILHLEDSKADVALIRHAVEAAQPPLAAVFQVVATRKAFEAALKEGCADLILCDYRLPGYDGDAALKAARASLPDVPFILVTGELDEDRAIDTLKAGATDYVLKDNLRRLVPVMRRALRDAALLREHRKAAEALRQSERIYRAIGETINYGIWICDADGRNTYASQSLLDLVGATQQECSEFGWGNYLHPDDVAETIAAWQRCTREGTDWEWEHRYKGRDGSYHHVLARGIPIRDERGKVLCWAGINLDIDAIKRTEQALRDSERRLQDLIRLAPTFIYEIDFRGPRFTSVNEAMCTFSGYSREELLATSPFELLTPESQAAFRKRIAQWLVGEKPAENVEYRARVRSGEERWVVLHVNFTSNNQGKPVGATVIGHDVTERKKAELVLQASERKYRELFESMSEGFLLVEPVFDAEGRPVSYRYLDANIALERLTHLKRSDIIGKTVHDVLDSVESPWVACFARVATTGKSEQLEEYSRALNGWFSLHVYCPEPGKAAVIYSNITARKQMEEELRRSVENLHLMVQAAPKPIMVVNAEGIIEAVNEVGAQLMGFRENELRGCHVKKFTLPFSRMEMDLRLGELRRLAPLPVSTVLRVRTGNGTTQWMNVEASFLKAEFGREKYLIRYEKLDLGLLPHTRGGFQQ